MGMKCEQNPSKISRTHSSKFFLLVEQILCLPRTESGGIRLLDSPHVRGALTSAGS